MEGISDIRIIGIDETRPPRIRKEPYINLYFKLSHKAPERWCEDFTRIVAHNNYSVKLDPAEGLYIDTWVRKPDEIEGLVAILKVAVKRCNEEFVARVAAEAKDAAARGDMGDEVGEQGRLNRIVAGLKFDD